jgi:predicted protein tyrosine phosphatase
MSKLKILFVCTANKLRSKTAEEIYANDPRFEVDSAGTSQLAENQVDEYLLNWADYVIVMEKNHRDFIHQKYPEIYQKKRIICLFIPDNYDFMQPELVSILRTKFELVYEREIAHQI